MKLLLCVAEKPAAARTAATILSKGKYRTEPSASKKNPNYFFPAQFLGENVEIVFTSVLGHIFQIDFPPEYESWTKVDPSELFRARLVTKIPDHLKDTGKNVELLSRRAFGVMLWLDNDREGEYISEEVEHICKTANPSIQVYRARFPALAPSDLWRALNNPTDINRADALAVRLRSELDLRTGAAFTRFQTLRYRGKLSTENTVLSYGPCQFPTLGFVVDAYLKREKFVPEEYWVIDASIKKDNTVIPLKWVRKRLFCKLSCFAIYSAMFDGEPKAVVSSVSENKKLKWKPLPLATVEFQKKATQYLKMDSMTAMTLAEGLYQQGCISYPRTETDSYPDNFDFKSIIDTLTGYQDVSNYAASLRHNFDVPRKGKHTDNAHPPIYPLKVPPSFKSADEKKVYNFIVHHYLACCSKDAIGMETLVYFDIAGEAYKLKGLRIVEKNWLDIYPYTKWEANIIPKFTIAEVCNLTLLKMNERKTVAPKLLSETDLISLMDKEGIGTDATIPDHIKTIQDRGYAKKVAGSFVPQPLGLALVNGYESMGFDFAKPYLRAETEKTMQKISAGQEDFTAARQKFVAQYATAFDRLSHQAILLDRAFEEQKQRMQSTQQAETTTPAAPAAPRNRRN